MDSACLSSMLREGPVGVAAAYPPQILQFAVATSVLRYIIPTWLSEESEWEEKRTVCWMRQLYENTSVNLLIQTYLSLQFCEEKGDGDLFFLKEFSWETDFWVTEGDFTIKMLKKNKIGKRNLHLTENPLRTKEIWCAGKSHYIYLGYVCHTWAKLIAKYNQLTIVRRKYA